MNQNNKIFLGIAVVIGFAVIFLVAYSNLNQDDESDTSVTSEDTSIESDLPSVSTPVGSDIQPAPVDPNEGEILLSESEYITPGGAEPISVRIELAEDDTIKNIDVFLEASIERSTVHQAAFMQAFDAIDFEGKTVAEAEIDKVTNASLTSVAFNKAIAELSD